MISNLASTIRSLIFFATYGLLAWASAGAEEVSYSDCRGADEALAGSDGVLYCEPFETADFWKGKGYLKDGSRNFYPAEEDRFTKVSTETDQCVSGNCIRIEIPQYECCGVAVAWPLEEAGLKPDNLYFRYYLKLGDNFDPALCKSDGSSAGDGGKFPGLADPRAWPEEQCGNGGNPSDGLNCWSARSLFKSCTFACEENTQASTRFGTYAYHPYQNGLWGDHAVWDADTNRQSGRTCEVTHNQDQNCPTDKIVACDSGPDVVGTCGFDNVGDLENGVWHAIEMQVSMNTPGKDDGVLRGWVDGELAFEKTNMVWRKIGHDNLHVRLVWLNVHFGGEFVGPCSPGGTEVYIDQMVVATTPVGVAGNFQPALTPNPPNDLIAD